MLLTTPIPHFHMVPIKLLRHLRAKRGGWPLRRTPVTWEHLQRYIQGEAIILDFCEETGTAAPVPHPTQWVQSLGQA